MDVFGTAFAALCDNFVVFVDNVMGGEQHKFDLEADRISLFMFSGRLHLASVKNISETQDLVTLWTIDQALTKVWQRTIAKVYALTTCAKIKFQKALNSVENNNFYTGVTKQDNPDFFDVDAEEAPTNFDDFLLVQSLDKEILRLPLDGSAPVTQYELPVLCPTILSAYISGEEAVIAMHPPTMRLFINSRLF